jgi:Anti-sigma factor NepR
MDNDNEPPSNSKTVKLNSALPAQIGQKLRTLFDEVESEPVPDRLRELIEALAAKEKKPE